jgi:glutamate--cysteine ligase
VFGGRAYRDALAAAQQAWRAPQRLPSARVLQAIARDETCGFTAFVRERSLLAQQQLLALPWSHEQQARFEREAQASLAEQAAIEAADTMPFEAFRQDYVSAERLMPALVTA